MNSINFPQVNRVYGEKPVGDDATPAYNSLSTCATVDENGYPLEVSCWTMNSDEVSQFLRTGRIYLKITTAVQPPVSLTPFNPFVTPRQNEKELLENKAIAGSYMIWIERMEQIFVHGFNVKSDEKYIFGELKIAAQFCIDPKINEWPYTWDLKFKEKILAKTEKERLAIGGAFLAAHIDWITNQEIIHESEN